MQRRVMNMHQANESQHSRPALGATVKLVLDTDRIENILFYSLLRDI